MLGLGSNSYEQRLPDLIWEQPDAAKWALLSGLFEGDGSWSLINGGPSVIIELGTVSDELADGVLRLLGDLGIVASRRIGRVAKSTKDTHWIRIGGAEQVERAIELVPERDRRGVFASIASPAASGSRRRGIGDSATVPAWVRMTSARVASATRPRLFARGSVRAYGRDQRWLDCLATASRRMSPRSSSSPATPATTSSC